MTARRERRTVTPPTPAALPAEDMNLSATAARRTHQPVANLEHRQAALDDIAAPTGPRVLPHSATPGSKNLAAKKREVIFENAPGPLDSGLTRLPAL